MKDKIQILKDLIDEFDCNVSTLVPDKSLIKDNILKINEVLFDIENNI